VLGGKARAVLAGRTFVGIDDIRAVASPVLRHRIITSFSAEADRVDANDVVDWLLKETPAVAPIDNPAVARIFRGSDQ
jgi:MoxR-like ATPase